MKNTTMILIGGGIGLAAYLYFRKGGACTDCAGASAPAPSAAPARTFQRDPGFGAGVAVTAHLPQSPAAPAAGAPGGLVIKSPTVSMDTIARSPASAIGAAKLVKRDPHQSPPIIPQPGPKGPGPIYGAQPY